MSFTLQRKAVDEDDLYPYSDGEPMAESELHAGEMAYALYSIEQWLENRPDAHVSMDTFLYYQEGIPSAVVSPDLYVVFGSDKAPRKSWKAWQEGGRLPSFVLEITSRSTRYTDFPRVPNGIPRPRARRRLQTGKNKFQIYERVLEVAEYFLFDPTGDYLAPRLKGYRLVAGRYVEITAEPDPLPRGEVTFQPAYWLYSEQLGLALSYEGPNLRFYNPASGDRLLRAAEAVSAARTQTQLAARAAQARAEAEQRAMMEAQARAESEAELARLRAELEALRNQRSG